MQYIENPIINWTWYIGVPDNFDLNATEVEIQLYDRKRMDDETRPIRNKFSGRLIEEPDTRIVTGLQIDTGEIFPVSNPKHVFSYPKFKD